MELPEVCVCYLIRSTPRGDEVLLGEKRRGLGQGRVVAPGGKLEPGETPTRAIVREVLEEVGLVVAPEDLRAHGYIDYRFPSRTEWSQRSWVFSARDHRGEPIATAELDARWVPVEEVPFDLMWDDARYWLPGVLAGESVAVDFDFAPDNATAVLVKR
ncbi:NUDIX domain-containing protein [Mycetocola lacteus]|uniref:Oxidized purine nucleoside triphosphate hydrolase n=1 Tax=Mycetocola lacteus TaxID=76637 RepID=A0A3L7AVJ8_9MICO|nr:NUDIX domain-containing protein [Mycetocola lacteus]RLP84204.1 NUDIX domain-containing protein [Mycetocola lacteus]